MVVLLTSTATFLSLCLLVTDGCCTSQELCSVAINQAVHWAEAATWSLLSYGTKLQAQIAEEGRRSLNNCICNWFITFAGGTVLFISTASVFQDNLEKLVPDYETIPGFATATNDRDGCGCCSLEYVPKSLKRHLCHRYGLWLLEERAGQEIYPWNERAKEQEQNDAKEKQVPWTISVTLCKWQSRWLVPSPVAVWPNTFIESPWSPRRGCIRWPPWLW